MYSLGRNPANEVNSDDEEGRGIERRHVCERVTELGMAREDVVRSVVAVLVIIILLRWSGTGSQPSLSSPTARPVEC